jgi:hypothetical protein
MVGAKEDTRPCLSARVAKADTGAVSIDLQQSSTRDLWKGMAIELEKED